MNAFTPSEEVRRASVAARTPQAEVFDRRAVCAGLVAQIAVAEAYGCKVVAIKVGHVAYASVVAACAMKLDPPPDRTLEGALVIANAIGLSLACGAVPDETLIEDRIAREAFRAVKWSIAQQPASRFVARVNALQVMVEPGWRKLGHG